jgi:ParB family chromosome partitioning protein
VGRRGLGRGLSALIATGESVGGLRFEEVPVSSIRPNSHQPRRNFSEASINELAASIREVGILQPLVIRATETGFELIAGERRLRAAKVAGLDRVPVLIRQAMESESMELALVENLQREDLNPIETATAYQALMESFGLTKEQLAARLGKSRAAVTNTLRLVRLPGALQEMVVEGVLTEGHARALLALEDEGAMREVAERIAAERLSVRKTEEIVRAKLGRETEGGASDDGASRPPPPREYGEAARRIEQALSMPAKIRSTRRGGKLEIAFHGTEQLEALISRLTTPPAADTSNS